MATSFRQGRFPHQRKATQGNEAGKCFMLSENVPVESGPWRNLETLCLMVCREVLLGHEVSVNARNLQMLYDFIARSDVVKDMSLLIGYKSTAQVAAKILHLEGSRM